MNEEIHREENMTAGTVGRPCAGATGTEPPQTREASRDRSPRPATLLGLLGRHTILHPQELDVSFGRSSGKFSHIYVGRSA